MVSISSLPIELLEAIAAAGQEGHDYGHSFKAEWTLSQVSRRFRDIIIGARALWTEVATDFGYEGRVEILKLYLERSQPLSISVAMRHSTLTDMRFDERLRQIVPHINRIWRLSIALDTYSMGLLAPFRDLAAPKLRHLEIVKDDLLHRPSSLWPSIQIFSAGAPKLTVLKMDGFKPHLPVPLWTASLTRLEFWSGQDLVDEDATPILSAITEQCTSLVHLYLDINWMDPTGQPFHIPSLKTLHISTSDSEAEDYLLGIADLFNTPALTTFIIDNAYCAQILLLLNAKSLPHASFPALTSFSLVNESICPCEENVPFSESISLPITLFPALSSVTLVNQCLAVTFVRDIIVSASQPWPLKTITLCPQSNFLDGVSAALGDGIHSAHQSGRTLPKFRVSPALFSLIQDDGKADVVEIFEPTQIINSLDWRTRAIAWSSRTEVIY
ncbi:hypothetical protein K438DRAFT_2009084 [Mycena galopus ATCC 62051]|nr:hypothetical protein K438DRAFT_2009084 [Mycena galopus ATCC 62051]